MPVEYGDTISIEQPAAAPAAATSRISRMLLRLDEASDRLSPIVVKEVRQIVRGREFNYSFMISLVVGLLVAFFGAASASEQSAAGPAYGGALNYTLASISNSAYRSTLNK